MQVRGILFSVIELHLCIRLQEGSVFLLSFLLHLKRVFLCFRILLNYFKWDKEKLMEKYFSEDQEAMFSEAHVISPYRYSTYLKGSFSDPKTFLKGLSHEN